MAIKEWCFYSSVRLGQICCLVERGLEESGCVSHKKEAINRQPHKFHFLNFPQFVKFQFKFIGRCANMIKELRRLSLGNLGPSASSNNYEESEVSEFVKFPKFSGSPSF